MKNMAEADKYGEAVHQALFKVQIEYVVDGERVRAEGIEPFVKSVSPGYIDFDLLIKDGELQPLKELLALDEQKGYVTVIMEAKDGNPHTVVKYSGCKFALDWDDLLYVSYSGVAASFGVDLDFAEGKKAILSFEYAKLTVHDGKGNMLVTKEGQVI